MSKRNRDPFDSCAEYAATTRAVRVGVRSLYLDDESDPDAPQYVWAYRIEITNDRSDTVQLLTRHWRITDAHGRTEEVHGAGVVGEQPVLRPGETFAYTSGTPLPTSSGFMTGTYEMADADGALFNVDIPAFSLDHPDHARAIH